MITDETIATAPPSGLRSFVRVAIKWLLVFGCCYLGVLLVLWILENRLVYRPTPADAVWEPAPSDEFEDVWLKTTDGTKIHAWWLPHPESDTAMIVLHGNAGNLSQRGYSVAAFREYFQTSVLIVDYPGFGKSGGKPSEQGCYASADAAYEWLTAKRSNPVSPKQIVIYGDSLGGGVATHLASRKKHRALILIRTFTSIPDTAKHLHWWLPAHWLMCNRFDNLVRIKQCQRPVFIAHGTHDSLIPVSHGKALFEAAPGEKELFLMQDADHNDPLPKEMFEKAKEFLDHVSLQTSSPHYLVG